MGYYISIYNASTMHIVIEDIGQRPQGLTLLLVDGNLNVGLYNTERNVQKKDCGNPCHCRS